MNDHVIRQWATTWNVENTTVLVRDALFSLTAQQRAIVIMRHRDGMSFSAIAAALDVTVRAVTRCHERAVASAQRQIQNRKR